MRRRVHSYILKYFDLLTVKSFTRNSGVRLHGSSSARELFGGSLAYRPAGIDKMSCDVQNYAQCALGRLWSAARDSPTQISVKNVNVPTIFLPEFIGRQAQLEGRFYDSRNTFSQQYRFSQERSETVVEVVASWRR